MSFDREECFFLLPDGSVPFSFSSSHWYPPHLQNNFKANWSNQWLSRAMDLASLPRYCTENGSSRGRNLAVPVLSAPNSEMSFDRGRGRGGFSLSLSLALSLTLTHTLTQSLTPSLTHSLTHSLSPSLSLSSSSSMAWPQPSTIKCVFDHKF